MSNIIVNLITSSFFGMFILTSYEAIIDVAYNLKNDRETHPEAWFIPAIFAAGFWFFSHL